MGWSRKRVVCTFNRIASEHMKSSISRKSGFFFGKSWFALRNAAVSSILVSYKKLLFISMQIRKTQVHFQIPQREREKTKHEIKKLNPFAQPSIHLNQPQSSESTRDHVAYALHQTIPHEMLCGYIFTMPVLSRNE